MSHTPFILLNFFKDQLDPDNLFLEIGSDRGSGSSYYLYALAKETNNNFITVDIDPVYLNKAIYAYTMRGDKFITEILPHLNKKVSLAYMDGFDWINNPADVRLGTASAEVYNLIGEYTKKGEQLNNLNSSLDHAKQILDLMKHLSNKCIIMFADTRFNYVLDTIEGKGAGAAYILLASGFKILSASAKDQYMILGRDIKDVDSLPNLNIDSLNVRYEGISKPQNHIVYKNDD